MGETLALEPVDEVSDLTVCDNVVDMLLPDQGPAMRLSRNGGQHVPMLDAPVLEGGKAIDAPLAQHGFSALVEIRKGAGCAVCCSIPASRPADAPTTCTAWARTRRTSKSSSAAMGTSTTPPGYPD
jgi:hypothetical protein